MRNCFPSLSMTFVTLNVSMCAGFLRAVERAQWERTLAAFAKGLSSASAPRQDSSQQPVNPAPGGTDTLAGL